MLNYAVASLSTVNSCPRGFQNDPRAWYQEVRNFCAFALLSRPVIPYILSNLRWALLATSDQGAVSLVKKTLLKHTHPGTNTDDQSRTGYQIRRYSWPFSQELYSPVYSEKLFLQFLPALAPE